MTTENPPVGSQVRIVEPVSDMEKDLMRNRPGEIFQVQRYTEPHGFAVIEDVIGARWWVHPEALRVVQKKSLE